MNKKIKICFVSLFAYGIFYPESKLKFGGSEVQLALVSRELAKDGGYDASLLVLDAGQNWLEEKKDGVRLIKAYKRGRGVNLLRAPQVLFFGLIKESPDIIVCRANGVEVGISRLYAWLFGKKFIYSIAHDHDIDGNYFHGLRGRIFKWGFESADWLIAQNEEQKKEFIKRYPKKASRIAVIKNSFGILPGKAEEKSAILWVGSSAPAKRAEILLRLAKDFPKEKFEMVIAKSGLEKGAWEKFFEQSRGLKNLELKDFVPFAEISAYFDRAKVLVNTSSGEGFPNVFLQAGLSRTPILSLKVDPDDFIKKNNCGFVCADDYNQLKNNLAKMLVGGRAYNELSLNIFRYVEREHDIEKNIDSWKKIFKDILL